MREVKKAVVSECYMTRLTFSASCALLRIIPHDSTYPPIREHPRVTQVRFVLAIGLEIVSCMVNDNQKYHCN